MLLTEKEMKKSDQ